MIFSDLVGIIADDLTGANDTALQFHQRGASTKILLDSECTPKIKAGTEVWALSSESRNVPADEAVLKVEKAIIFVEEIVHIEEFIDRHFSDIIWSEALWRILDVFSSEKDRILSHKNHRLF